MGDDSKHDSVPKPGPTPPLGGIKGVEIRFIEHSEQRYETVGDWFVSFEGVLVISVDRMSDIRYTLAVAFHEFIEAVGCINRGITAEMVDEFDMSNCHYDEPGTHPSAPYHREHRFATALEYKFVQFLGLDKETYDKAVTDKGETR